MADVSLEVILQIHMGLPWRQASEGQKKKALDEWPALVEKWKASGIRLIATFQAPHVLDGYSNNYLFSIPGLAQMSEMNADIMASGLGKVIQDFRLALGSNIPDFEKLWKS